MKFNKIKVYLRQTNTNKLNNGRPEWFDYEKIFKNLLITTNFKLADLTVCFDGTQEEYNSHYTIKYKDQFPFRVVLINTKEFNGYSYENDGSSKSGGLVAKIINNDNLPEDNLIYILENDYLHQNHWVDLTLDLFNRYIGDNYYVSLYDHLDKYIFTQSEETINSNNLEGHWRMYRDLQSKIILSSYCHWREVPLICSSWIMSRQLFNRDYDLLSCGISDNTMCGKISELYKTKFLSPIPSLATHCQNPFIAPFVDWNKIINL